MCAICMTKGGSPGFFSRLWLPPEGGHLSLCSHCHGILEKHGLCGPLAREEAHDACCESCADRDPWSGVVRPKFEHRLADHRLQPCRCSLCRSCAETVIVQDLSSCPVCGQVVRWIVDERALATTGWTASARRSRRKHDAQRSCSIGECASRRA